MGGGLDKGIDELELDLKFWPVKKKLLPHQEMREISETHGEDAAVGMLVLAGLLFTH